MGDAGHHTFDQAIQRISSSDPIIKLLHEVKLGRMRATDAGLRATTESWIETYRHVIQTTDGLDRGLLLRLDPRPRLDLLADVGVVPATHPGAMALKAAFEDMLRTAPSAR